MGIKTDNNNLIPDDDYEYEKQLAEQERARRIAEKTGYNEQLEYQKEQEHKEQKEREKRIAQEKVELMKLKSGVIDESDTIKEEHDEVKELHGTEKISNFFYHYKIMIFFIVFLVAVVSFIVYDTATREKADITIMMIANNGLSMRTDELEEFFEKYTDDLNGDGKVHVSIMSIPINPDSNNQAQVANNSKFYANLQNADSIMMITDSNTDPDTFEILKSDLSKDFPDNPYIDDKGFSLNFKFLSDEFKYENMPNDVYISMRIPNELTGDSLETMEKNYDDAFVVFSKIVEDLTARAEETDDPGLSTEPIKSTVTSDIDSEQDSSK